MFELKKAGYLYAVCTGKIIPQTQIPDEAFATGMLGQGFGMEPMEGHFYAPAEGIVDNIAQARHAYTIITEDDLEVLVHIGVDTVGLNGEGFVPQVEAGARVKAGDLLADANLSLIREKGFPVTTAVLITNAECIKNIEYKYGSAIGGKTTAMCFRRSKKG